MQRLKWLLYFSIGFSAQVSAETFTCTTKDVLMHEDGSFVRNPHTITILKDSPILIWDLNNEVASFYYKDRPDLARPGKMTLVRKDSVSIVGVQIHDNGNSKYIFSVKIETIGRDTKHKNIEFPFAYSRESLFFSGKCKVL